MYTVGVPPPYDSTHCTAEHDGMSVFRPVRAELDPLFALHCALFWHHVYGWHRWSTVPTSLYSCAAAEGRPPAHPLVDVKLTFSPSTVHCAPPTLPVHATQRSASVGDSCGLGPCVKMANRSLSAPADDMAQHEPQPS